MNDMRVRPHDCVECGETMEVKILRDRGRLFYVGAACACGPYSRETASVSLVSAISAFDRVEL